MKRYKLTDARTARGMSQRELADAIAADEVSVARWEHGIQTPQAHFIGKLCEFFGVKPAALNLDAEFNDKASTQWREDDILEMLRTYDRRQLLELLSQLPAFAGVDLTVLFSTTVVAPEKLLNVSRSVIDGCWDMLDQKVSPIADGLLATCVSELESLAVHSSKYQPEAAALIVEATIIQMIIAIHKTNYSRSRRLSADAVRFGELSGDGNMHAMALGWQGNAYYKNQPGKAIEILTTALRCGDDVSMVNKADIYIGLALAYALDTTQEDHETKARDFATLAQMTLPENPELDSLYHIIGTGQSELDQREGQVYLILAQRYPANREYAQRAHDAYMKSVDQPPLSLRYRSQALIHKAQAACIIADMDGYLDCLEEGVPIVCQIDSKQQIAQAVTVIQKAPRTWRSERRYKELRNVLTPSGVIVRT